MSTLSVRVRNPFVLRGSLEVVLEVARMDLANAEIEEIRASLAAIPNSVRPTELQIPLPGGAAPHCWRSATSNQSRTRHWLREEMVSALLDLERALERHLRDAARAGAQEQAHTPFPGGRGLRPAGREAARYAPRGAAHCARSAMQRQDPLQGLLPHPLHCRRKSMCGK